MQTIMLHSTAVLFAALISASPLPKTQNETVAASYEHALQLPDCGLVYVSGDTSDRIVGGRDAYAGEFPWLVSLREEQDGDFEHVCGAAILNARWILTAAHCFYQEIEDSDPPEYIIRDSVHDHDIVVGLLNQEELRASAAVRKVRIHKLTDIIIHPRYDFSSNVNDIALLRTSRSIGLKNSNGYVNSICLPKSNTDPKGIATVSGWGDLVDEGDGSDMLQAVNVEIKTREVCKKVFPELTKNMICAGNKGKDSCQGDSGGPLVQYDKSGRATVVGVVSYGLECGMYPGVYTRVSAYLEWINSNAQ